MNYLNTIHTATDYSNNHNNTDLLRDFKQAYTDFNYYSIGKPSDYHNYSSFGAVRTQKAMSHVKALISKFLNDATVYINMINQQTCLINWGYDNDQYYNDCLASIDLLMTDAHYIWSLIQRHNLVLV